MTSISIITPIWKRSTELLHRMLSTLSGQTAPPLEIIVVDMNPDADEALNVEAVCGQFPLAKHLRAPMTIFHASRAINIGIRASDESADYLAVTGSEMMFSKNYLEEIAAAITPDGFTRTRCATLSKDIAVPLDPHSDWERLCTSIDPDSILNISPGTFMCTVRPWWFMVHGYDEANYFTLIDVDFCHRAELNGLTRICLAWKTAQAIHQWHEPSPLFYDGRGQTWEQFYGNQSIVRNDEHWGML